MTGRGALDGRLGIIPMTSDGDGALFIALTTLVAMLDEKGLLSEQEFIDALQGEQKGRSDGLKSVLQQMIVRMTPPEPPSMLLIDGGKSDLSEDK
jgi:hypothetical protein